MCSDSAKPEDFTHKRNYFSEAQSIPVQSTRRLDHYRADTLGRIRGSPLLDNP
jgi:hypothetical protein